MPLGSMSWPHVDNHTYRSTDSCGKGHGLNPHVDNACKDVHSIDSDPNKVIRWGQNIETKWFWGRSSTPIRTKRKKTCVTSCPRPTHLLLVLHYTPTGQLDVTICSSKTSRYDASEANTPVRVMAQRQRPNLTRGSNRSWVSTATVRHASGASVFCQGIVSRRCHVPVMFIGCPNSPQRVFSMSLASVAMFVDFSTRRSLYITTRTVPSHLAAFREGIPPHPPPRLPLRMTGSFSG